MARWWKERVQSQHVHSYVTYSDGTQRRVTHNYCMAVCSFTFVFHFTDEIPKYIAYYETKILPSRRIANYNVRDHGDHWECQRWYDLLPRIILRLREGAKRRKVVDALQRAYSDFQKTEAKHRK